MGLTTICRGWIQTLVASGTVSHILASICVYLGPTSIWQQPFYLLLLTSVFGALPEMQKLRDKPPGFHLICLLVSLAATGVFCIFAYRNFDVLACVWIALSLIFIFVSASHLHYSIRVRKEESELPVATVKTMASDEIYDQMRKDGLI